MKGPSERLAGIWMSGKRELLNVPVEDLSILEELNDAACSRMRAGTAVDRWCGDGGQDHNVWDEQTPLRRTTVCRPESSRDLQLTRFHADGELWVL